MHILQKICNSYLLLLFHTRGSMLRDRDNTVYRVPVIEETKTTACLECVILPLLSSE